LSWASQSFELHTKADERLAAEIMGSAAQSLSEMVDLRLIGYFSLSAALARLRDGHWRPSRTPVSTRH